MTLFPKALAVLSAQKGAILLNKQPVAYPPPSPPQHSSFLHTHLAKTILAAVCFPCWGVFSMVCFHNSVGSVFCTEICCIFESVTSSLTVYTGRHFEVIMTFTNTTYLLDICY